MHTALAILLKSKKPLPEPVIAQAIAKMVMRAKTILITFGITLFSMQSRSFIKSRFAILLWLYYTMNTPETQSPIDTTDIPIDNIGNRQTLKERKCFTV